MPLTRQHLTVYVADDQGEPLEHTVEITLGDQLRGELEAKKNGISLELPMHTTVVWCWAALTRLGLYAGGFQQFKNVDCLGFDKAGEADEVDPTTPAPAGSA